MKDQADTKTPDLLGESPKRGRGRPAKHADDDAKRAAAAEAARRYRQRKKEAEAARRVQPPTSSIIDLSQISFSKRSDK